jgi:hypothetical protein
MLEATSMQAFRKGQLLNWLLDLSEDELDIRAHLAQEQYGEASVANHAQCLHDLGFK